MYRSQLLLSAILVPAFLAPLRAQVAAPNQMGVSIGHLHAYAKDPEAERSFWLALGGVPAGSGRLTAAKFPGILVFINRADTSAGTAGSVIDHVGFLVKDAKAAQAKWKEAGLSAITPFDASNQGAFLLSPAGIRVEFNEDASLKDPIVFHHIHWVTPDPAAIQAWYAKTFGAVPGKRKNFAAADVPGTNLTFDKATGPKVGTKGRGLDHIGFEIQDLAAFCKKLEAEGQKFDVPYNPRPGADLEVVFITDPFGTYIELTRGLNRY
ncbi:MAG: VOC family protein [Bryobacteraceae bacterium]|jgi:catechol 2,3-dioxygenase-like lactoylglutathione lyase family enzyme